MFTQVRLRPNQCLRGSGHDISTFFYHLKTPMNWWRRNRYGRVFSGDDAAVLGGDPRVRYHMALVVTAMGDLNAVGLAQTTH